MPFPKPARSPGRAGMSSRGWRPVLFRRERGKRHLLARSPDVVTQSDDRHHTHDADNDDGRLEGATRYIAEADALALSLDDRVEHDRCADARNRVVVLLGSPRNRRRHGHHRYPRCSRCALAAVCTKQLWNRGYKGHHEEPPRNAGGSPLRRRLRHALRLLIGRWSIDKGHRTLLVSGAADRALPGSGASLPSQLGSMSCVQQVIPTPWDGPGWSDGRHAAGNRRPNA